MKNLQAQDKLWASVSNVRPHLFFQALRDGADPFLLDPKGRTTLGVLLHPDSVSEMGLNGSIPDARKMLDYLIENKVHLYTQSDGLYPFQWAVLHRVPLCTTAHFNALCKNIPLDEIDKSFARTPHSNHKQTALAYCLKEKWTGFARRLLAKKANPHLTMGDGAKVWTRFFRQSYVSYDYHRHNKGDMVISEIYNTLTPIQIVEDLTKEVQAQEKPHFKHDSYGGKVLNRLLENQIKQSANDPSILNKLADFYPASLGYFPVQQLILENFDVHYRRSNGNPFWLEYLTNQDEDDGEDFLKCLSFSHQDLPDLKEIVNNQEAHPNLSKNTLAKLAVAQHQLELDECTPNILTQRHRLRL